MHIIGLLIVSWRKVKLSHFDTSRKVSEAKTSLVVYTLSNCIIVPKIFEKDKITKGLNEMKWMEKKTTNTLNLRLYTHILRIKDVKRKISRNRHFDTFRRISERSGSFFLCTLNVMLLVSIIYDIYKKEHISKGKQDSEYDSSLVLYTRSSF